ncbi:MAG: Fe-S-containing hydro-lyase [Pygmaiobacter massiliensis]|nr:Fe-S-containing hydro-lyase [Pygmaiobacter massiliensis]
MAIQIQTPFTEQAARSLRAGDRVLLSGTIYTARDAAHKRLCEMVARGEKLPFDPMDGIVYYVGPAPARPGRPIGSAGPTTSYRMDAYAPTLIGLGLRGMIGKGYRSSQVVDAMRQYGGVYFAAIGGAGALIGRSIKAAEVIAFEDLGPEALRRLQVEDFPLTVVIDSEGNDLYQIGRREYLESLNR